MSVCSLVYLCYCIRQSFLSISFLFLRALARGPQQQSSRAMNNDLQMVQDPSPSLSQNNSTAQDTLIGQGELSIPDNDDNNNNNNNNGADGNGAPVETRWRDLHPVLKGYLLGQIANVIKFGVWWVGFTYLILAFFNGSTYLVGGARICFNLALLFCSPLAGGVAERANIRTILLRTTTIRGIIYVLLIPAAWFFLDSEILYSKNHAMSVAFFVIFLLLIFLDGVGVSFSNVADIDSVSKTCHDS